MSLNSKEAIIEAIQNNAKEIDFYAEVPKEFQINPEILGLAVYKRMIPITDDMRDNQAMWEQVVALSKYLRSDLLNDVSDRLKDDDDFVALVLNKDLDNYQYASQRIQNDPKWAWKLTEGGLYQKVPDPVNRDPAMILRAFETHSQTFYHLPEDLRDNQQYIDLAMKHSLGDSIVFNAFPDKYKDNDDIAFRMVRKSGYCFRHVSDRLKANKELALIALEQDARTIENMPEKLQHDIEIVKKTMTGGSRYSLGYFIRCIPPDILAQEDIAILGAQTGQDLEFFPTYKDNKELVLQFITNKLHNYLKASDRLKADRDVALAYVGHKHSWVGLDEVPQALRTDKTIVEQAILGTAENAKYIPQNLLSDSDFLLSLLEKESDILRYLPKSVAANLVHATIETLPYRGRTLKVTTVPDTNWTVSNGQRAVDTVYIRNNGITELTVQSMTVLTYESDGPVGSYLSTRMRYNIVLCGDFAFLVGHNTGFETYSNHTSKGRYICCGYSSNCLETNHNFKNHHVWLLESSEEPLSFDEIRQKSTKIYTGLKSQFLPVGISLFQEKRDYNDMMTMLTQNKSRNSNHLIKKGEYAVEVQPLKEAVAVGGAARVYVDSHGWRWLLPHSEGSAASLKQLQESDHVADWTWFEDQLSTFTDTEKNHLLQHFKETHLSQKVQASVG